MDEYTKVEISVLFDALYELRDHLKHYPTEFSYEEAEALEGLYESFHLEAQYRGIIA
jgi:hypothetical protein